MTEVIIECLSLSKSLLVKSYNFIFILDENAKYVAIEESSKETKDGVVDPTPSLTSSSKIFVTK